MFKSKIETWETDKFPCRVCKTYIQRVGFIWMGTVTSHQCSLNIIFAVVVICLFVVAVVVAGVYYYYHHYYYYCYYY